MKNYFISLKRQRFALLLVETSVLLAVTAAVLVVGLPALHLGALS